ncbi:MAG: DUF3108 domain-containing protein [Elusimicrobiota bacterium]
MRPFRGAVFFAAAVVAGVAAFTACAVHHRTTDPVPTSTASEPPRTVAPKPPLRLGAPSSAASTPTSSAPPAAPVVSSAPALPEPASPPAAAPATLVSTGTAPLPAAKPRAWGLVAITTAVISPAQLMGPEVPLSPSFMRLPVFPEKLTLAVSWGLLSVGEATMSVDKIVMFNGRPAYHLVTEARSNAFCDTFYVVRDLNESWLDAKTLTSLGYSKQLREGRFFRDEWVLYDRDDGTFVDRRTNKDGSFSVRTGTIPARVQDILSSVYFVRAHDLPDGGEVIVDVNTPDNWPLVVKVTKRETVKVPQRRGPAVLVEPAMRREGLFIQKGKRLRLWLSDDAERRPLMMKVEVFFGHVTAVLREMI